MREIPREPNNQRFLLKAVGEAGSELAEELMSVGRRDADRASADGWSYRLIAAHVRDHEAMTLSYLKRIVSRREPRLEAVDTERVLDEPELLHQRLDSLVSEFHHLRQQTLMLLWDLSDSAWERRGIHEYRGPCSVLQLARELHLHDLDYLWRVRRMREGTIETGRASSAR